MTKQFPFAWINLSRAFGFKICFGKTLVVFDFDEKFTQSVAHMTMLHHVSARLSSPALCGWSIQGHDLEREECSSSKNV